MPLPLPLPLMRSVWYVWTLFLGFTLGNQDGMTIGEIAKGNCSFLHEISHCIDILFRIP
jgi:hypothetical protein